MGIMDKLKKNSRIKGTAVLEDSIYFGEKDVVTTEVPMINVALSGDVYVLQAGSFRAIGDADRRRGELALLGLESSIEQMNTDTGSWHRVYIGPFDSRSAMAKARALTAQSDIDTLLLKRAQ